MTLDKHKAMVEVLQMLLDLREQQRKHGQEIEKAFWILKGLLGDDDGETAEHEHLQPETEQAGGTDDA